MFLYMLRWGSEPAHYIQAHNVQSMYSRYCTFLVSAIVTSCFGLVDPFHVMCVQTRASELVLEVVFLLHIYLFLCG